MIFVGKLVEGGILKWHGSFYMLPSAFVLLPFSYLEGQLPEMEQTAYNDDDENCALMMKEQKEFSSLWHCRGLMQNLEFLLQVISLCEKKLISIQLKYIICASITWI